MGRIHRICSSPYMNGVTTSFLIRIYWPGGLPNIFSKVLLPSGHAYSLSSYPPGFDFL